MTKWPDVPLCKNCKYHDSDAFGRVFTCIRPLGEVWNEVEGARMKFSSIKCIEERTSTASDFCGHKAQYYEPIR